MIYCKPFAPATLCGVAFLKIFQTLINKVVFFIWTENSINMSSFNFEQTFSHLVTFKRCYLVFGALQMRLHSRGNLFSYSITAMLTGIGYGTSGGYEQAVSPS